jgi:hypothetical protein
MSDDDMKGALESATLLVVSTKETVTYENKNNMKLQRNLVYKIALSAGLLLGLAEGARAVPFVYNDQADLFIGFRKVNPFTEANEAVVNIGSVSNYLNMAPGTTITNITQFTSSQLSPDTFSSLNHLTWSVFGMVDDTVEFFPADTIWVSNPRSNPATQSTPPPRADDSYMSNIPGNMRAIFGGAGVISGSSSPGPDNTATFVKEVIANSSGQNLSVYIAGSVNANLGTFQDSWINGNTLNPINCENSTSGTFTNNTTVSRSDLYQVIPNGYTDPYTGQTSGASYYVGYFTFNTNGVMSFTRAGGSVVTPPVISISRSGTTNTISFTSQNGGTYTLFYSSGLTTPTATWSSNAVTISGNGSGQSFQDITTGTNRFYRVGVH